jgi:hypothetical protein
MSGLAASGSDRPAHDETCPQEDLLSDWFEALTGAPSRLSPMFGTADARGLAVDIPVVYSGPSSGGMHAPGGCVDLGSAQRVAHVLVRTVVAWAG